MNEELLKIAHEKLGGESVGSYDEFVKDFNSSEELRKMAHQKLGGDSVGTYDEFIKDSGFSQNPIEKKPNNPQDYFGELFKPKETNSTFQAPAFVESEQIGVGEQLAAAMTATTNVDPTKRIEKRKNNSETRIKEQSQILYDNNKLLVDENTDELTKKESLLKSLNAARLLRKDASNSLKDNHGIDLGDADKLTYKLSRLQKQLDQVQREPLSPEQKELESTSINAEIESVQKQLKDFGERVSAIPEYGYLVQSSNDLRELNKMSDQYFPELKTAREKIASQQAKTDKIAKGDTVADDVDMTLRYLFGSVNSMADKFEQGLSAASKALNDATMSGDIKKEQSIMYLLKNEMAKGASDSFKPSSGQGSLKETYVKLDNGKRVIFVDGEPAFARDEKGYKSDLTEAEVSKANELYGDNSNVKKSFNGEALANNFIGTVFDMVPAVMLTSVSGGGSLGSMATIAATTAAQSFGGYYFDALEKGASSSKALGTSFAKSFVDGALENVGGLEAKLARGGVEKSTLNLLREETRAGLLSGKIAKNEIYKYYAKRLGDLGLESAKQGVGEYAEETLQSLNQGLFDLHAYNDNSTLAKIPGDALETFLISFALGAGSTSLQGLTNFKAKTKDDIRYNSILAAIKNPDKLQEVSDLLSTEKYGTSKNSDENYMFIQTMADDIEALDIKEDKDKLRAIQILVEKNNLETSSKKDNAGSVAAKIRNKKIKDLEAELNDLGRNKIFEVKEEDRKPKEEVEEEDTSIMDAVNRRMAEKEAEEKAAEEQTPHTVESLQAKLNPVVEEPKVNPMDRFSRFDPDAAGLLPADEETDTPKPTEEAVDGQTKPVRLPVQKEETNTSLKEIKTQSQEEFAQYLQDNHSDKLSQEQIYKLLTVRPELRERMLNESPQEWAKIFEKNPDYRQQANNVDNNKEMRGNANPAWTGISIGETANLEADGRHKGYVTLDVNSAREMGKNLEQTFKDLYKMLKDAGYNGHLKMPGVYSDLLTRFDNIVIHGATKGDVSLALPIIEQYFKNTGLTVEGTKTGIDAKDLNGKETSHTNLLAERVKNKQLTKAEEQSPSVTFEPKVDTKQDNNTDQEQKEEVISKLEAERDAEIETVVKPNFKLAFASAKELVNSEDPIGSREKNNEFKEQYKALKRLIDCL